MKQLFAILNFVLVLTLLAACAAPTAPNPTTTGPNATAPANPTKAPAPTAAQPLPTVVAVSNKLRNTSPTAKANDISQLVSGNSAFAFDLYQNLLDGESGNLFYSPYSISLAFAMLQAGARGDTLSQINKALHYTLDEASLHQAFNALQLYLTSHAQNADQPEQKDYTLNVANATWGQAGYQFLPAYLDVLAENYGAGMRLVDFKNDTEKTRMLINDWVSQQTNKKIQDLIPQGQLDELTRLVLTNAIYFNAGWMKTFDKNRTITTPFTNLDASQSSVPMMTQETIFGYTKGNGYQAINLPYSGGKLSMLMIVPDAGKFASFEKSLAPAQVESIRMALVSKNVNLSMPKFRIESSFSLAGALQKLGLVDAFDASKADLSGMDGTRNLSVTGVLHKSYVNVDEDGTEAAAATAIMVGLTSMPTETIELKIDRPFIFLIQDSDSGAILFIGRVTHL
jgi:serpin B